MQDSEQDCLVDDRHETISRAIAGAAGLRRGQLCQGLSGDVSSASAIPSGGPPLSADAPSVALELSCRSSGGMTPCSSDDALDRGQTHAIAGQRRTDADLLW